MIYLKINSFLLGECISGYCFSSHKIPDVSDSVTQLHAINSTFRVS